MSERYTIELDIELLADACLSTGNRTLGEPATRTCIPGRTLWGAAASAAYRKGMAEADAFRIFHQGEVRILDAVPTSPGGRAYPVPRSWHRPKADSAQQVSNFALKTAQDARAGVQHTPLGEGWIGPDLLEVSVAETYSLRTSVDPSGKARTGLLFGLPAIRAGSIFWTAVSGPKADVERVVELLEKEHLRLGRSRNAELGLARARRRESPIGKLEHGKQASEQISFLCVSRCILRDPATGSATLLPAPESFGLPESWQFAPELSFVRTARIVPFNSKRARPETERFALEQGSVVTFRGTSALPIAPVAETIANGIGEFTGEGYGEVVVAPEWLTRESVSPRKNEPSSTRKGAARPPGELFKWAEERAGKRKAAGELYEKAEDSARQFQRLPIPPAQWGVIHRLAREARFHGDEDALEERVLNFLRSGKRKLARGWLKGADALVGEMQKQKGERKALYLEFLASACMRPSGGGE